MGSYHTSLNAKSILFPQNFMGQSCDANKCNVLLIDLAFQGRLALLDSRAGIHSSHT